MNKNIERLYQIGQKESRYILGLMSGTSLDGLDLAFCKIKGSGLQTQLQLLHFDTISYTETFKTAVRTVFAKKQIDFPYLALLNSHIADVLSKIILDFLQKHDIDVEDVDLIASHGQTVMHVPKHQHDYPEMRNATLQIGDGDHIAVTTGIITISDFRQKHVAAGGEGAPLAVYGDYILNQSRDKDVILLNIGGISNFTFIPKGQSFSGVFVSDTGPGNTLMDTWMKTHMNLDYDQDAQLSSTGQVHQGLLAQLKTNAFFTAPFPKSTGQEVFNLQTVETCIQALHQPDAIAHADVTATLTQLTVDTIAEAIRSAISTYPVDIYLSGGGAHNPLIISRLKAALPECHLGFSDDIGIPSDAKEAIIFAILANETVAGNPLTFSGNQDIPGVSMGKISFPW